MSQWYVLIRGVQQGPLTLEELQQRIQQGTVTHNDFVWREGMAQWAPAGTMRELFSAGMPAPLYLRPHRGGAILALGILGITPCFICGIIAWVMANNDLKAMAAGVMDRSGQQMTQAGKICGIVGTILTCSAIALYVVWIVIMVVFMGVMFTRAAGV